MEAKFENVLVLLPALNEESTIAKTIQSVRFNLPESDIYVIDDRTIDEAMNCGVPILRVPIRGKGFAIRAGFRKLNIKHDAVVMLDGDDTYSCINLPLAVEKIRNCGYDMIVGTRVPSEKEHGRKKVFKRGHTIGNVILSKFNSILHPANVEDSLSGWRVMSPGFVKSFAGGASGFEIEAELNAHAYLLKCAVDNIDVEYVGRIYGSHSKLNTYSDGVKILRMNFLLFRNNRPQLAFSLLASPWLIMSSYLVLRSLLDYLRTGLVLQFPSLIAGVGCFITASLLFATGMILQRVKILRETELLLEYKRFN